MDADPTVRLMTVLDAVAARADEARERLDALAVRIGPAEQPVRPDPADPVRLTAIELAVAGTDRERTALLLRERYPEAELDAVLDDVFG